MGIIRQMGSWFAVPDMRNLGTTIRIVAFGIIAALMLPLVSGDGGSYFDKVLKELEWIVPVILINGLVGYFTNRFLVRYSHGVLIKIIACMAQFFIVDYIFLGTRGEFVRHLVLNGTGLLFMMYVEANRLRALSPAVSEARLTALTARIRPHFLFNSLNAAISLIRLRPYDAETLLENLANLFRAQLRDGGQYSTLGQEIEWAQEYIAIEQIRMGHRRVQVEWHHDAPDDAETPQLLLQPLLENAVFHGVETTHRPGNIVVQTALQGHWLYIRIENPFTPHENMENTQKVHRSNSMALKNLKERLDIMYDNDAQLKLEALDELGIYRVDIRLPYRSKEKETEYQTLFGGD